MDIAGEDVVVARGGRGGNPKTNFLGLKGDSKIVGFELKLLADVGLVGYVCFMLNCCCCCVEIINQFIL